MLASCAFRRLKTVQLRQLATCSAAQFSAPSINSYEISATVSIYDTAVASLARSHSSLGLGQNIFQLIKTNQAIVSRYFTQVSAACNLAEDTSVVSLQTEQSVDVNEAIWLSSTVKKRRMKMNKHKLKKRKKSLKMNTKVSRA